MNFRISVQSQCHLGKNYHQKLHGPSLIGRAESFFSLRSVKYHCHGKYPYTISLTESDLTEEIRELDEEIKAQLGSRVPVDKFYALTFQPDDASPFRVLYHLELISLSNKSRFMQNPSYRSLSQLGPCCGLSPVDLLNALRWTKHPQFGGACNSGICDKRFQLH